MWKTLKLVLLGSAMSIVGIAIVGIAFAAPASTATRDPYKWCAVWSGEEGGAPGCSYLTYEQCRAALHGTTDFCKPSPWYTGPADDETVPRARKRHRQKSS